MPQVSALWVNGTRRKRQKKLDIRVIIGKDMSREQWLAVRNQGIGSSDAAAAIGLSPYKSPVELWQEKTGRIHVPDLSEKEAVFWGSTAPVKIEA